MDRHAQSSSGDRRRQPVVSLVATLRCASSSCPTIYRTATGTYLIQGRPVNPQSVGIDIPADEALVEIPEELLTQIRDGGRRTG
jgi:hypothetical protein